VFQHCGLIIGGRGAWSVVGVGKPVSVCSTRRPGDVSNWHFVIFVPWRVRLTSGSVLVGRGPHDDALDTEILGLAGILKGPRAMTLPERCRAAPCRGLRRIRSDSPTDVTDLGILAMSIDILAALAGRSIGHGRIHRRFTMLSSTYRPCRTAPAAALPPVVGPATLVR